MLGGCLAIALFLNAKLDQRVEKRLKAKQRQP